MQNVKHLKVLTGFRFCAAFHVVCFHNFYLFGSIQESLPSFVYQFMQAGESAVAFFFILSGFILSHVYQNKLDTKNEKIKYLIARFAKIYPLYLLGLVLDAPRVISYFFSVNTCSSATLKTTVSGLASLLMMQSWYPRMTAAWNPPAWSLSDEMFFYILFIFFMAPLFHARRKAFRILFFYLIPLIVFLILQKTINTDSQTFVVWWRSFPPLRMFEFFIGISLYGLVNSNHPFMQWLRKNTSLVFWGALVISAFATLIRTVYIHSLIFTPLILVPLFSLMILSASYDSIRFHGLFTNPVIQYLGIISYAIYILHQPLKNYFSIGLEPSLLQGFWYFIGVIVVCGLAHRFVETPLQNRLKKSLGRFLRA